MYVFFHRMSKHHAGSRKGWYARRRRSLNQQLGRLTLQQRNAFPTAQQMHEFILQARRMAANTTQPRYALAYIALALACAVMNQAFPQAEANAFVSLILMLTFTMKQPAGSAQACHYWLQKDYLGGCFPFQKMKLRLYVIF